MLPAITILSGIPESFVLTYWASILVLNPKSPLLSALSSPSLRSYLGESLRPSNLFH